MASISSDRLQYLLLSVLSLAVLGFTGILYLSNPLLFQRFLGRINPLIASLVGIVLGFILLTFLHAQDWFAIYAKGSPEGLLRAAGLAALYRTHLSRGWNG